MYRIGNYTDFDNDYVYKQTANFATSLLIMTAYAFLTIVLKGYVLTMITVDIQSRGDNDNMIN